MNHDELLDMIGEVDEEYVLAADGGAAPPRFRWQTWAAAACAALILAAYPAWQMLPQKAAFDSAPSLEDAPEASQAPIRRPGLHEYTLAGDGQCAITAGGSTKAPSNDQSDPVPEQGGGSNAPAGTYIGGDAPADGPQDTSVEAAAAQYERLLRSLGLWGIDGRGLYPDWCGGVWLDGEYLTVSIVHGFRTRSLEQQILDWCGGTGEVLFADVTYSQNHLDGLMDEIDRIFDELDCHIFSSYGVYPDNRVHLDFFDMPSDEVLAALAGIDPDNSAIYILVFTDAQAAPTDGPAKGPAPGGE